MKTLVMLAMLSAAYAQDAPQSLKGTISNLGAEPAAYVPDDSLSYTVPLRPIEMLTAPVAIVPVFAVILPVVAPVDVLPYPIAGFGFHPRPAANGGHMGHISVSRGRR